MSILGEEPEKGEPGPVEGRPETRAAHRTRGGSSYQHSLSARGIKSSGRGRSCSDEDLLSSMERLERATRLPSFDDGETDSRRSTRAFGRHGGGTGQAGVSGGAEKRVRGPRFEW